MGNRDTPGGPPKVLPTPIRLKSTDPKDPPAQLDNAVPSEAAPVTNPPDALSSDATMSQETEVAAKPEALKEEPAIVLQTRTRIEHASDEEKKAMVARAAADSKAISDEKKQARAARRASSDLKVVDEGVAGYEDHDLGTLEGQIRLIQESLHRIVNLSGAPYMGEDAGEQIQRIVSAAPPKLDGCDLAVLTRVLLGKLEPQQELLGYCIEQFQKAHRLEALQSEVEIRQLAAEVNELQEAPDPDDLLLEIDDSEQLPAPTAEEMAPYWNLVPEIQCPEGGVVIGGYGEAMNAIAEGFPATHLDEDPRAEAIADLALALTGVRIGFEAFERSVGLLRGESTEEAAPKGARFPIVDTPNGPLLSDEERVALDAAVSGLADPSEWDTKRVASLPMVRAPSSRRCSPSMGSRGRTPIQGKDEAAPAVRRVKREQLVPVSALWSLAVLVVVLACVITAVLLREDTKDRRASLSRDTAQDLRADGFEARQDEFDEDLSGALVQLASQKGEVVSLTRERDGYQSLADQSVTVVGELRTEVNDLERDTRRRVSSVATDLSATQRDIRALQRQMQGSQGRERDLKDRIEATEGYATSMVNTQKCPTVGSGTLTSGQAGTIFECRQAGAKAFVICIGSDPATAHSCQATSKPK